MRKLIIMLLSYYVVTSANAMVVIWVTNNVAEDAFVVMNGQTNTFSSGVRGAGFPASGGGESFLIGTNVWDSGTLDATDGKAYGFNVMAGGGLSGIGWSYQDITDTAGNPNMAAFWAGVGVGIMFYGFGWLKRIIRQGGLGDV